jgi:exopolysaccharide biosynthesis protein
MRRSWKILTGVLLGIALCFGGYTLYDRGRPAPLPMKKTLYEGIVYQRIVRVSPHSMIAHVIRIDRKTAKVAFLVTPPDQEGDLPLKARTTSQFLDEFNLQIAINGDGFAPWWSRGPADYYPHVGDPVAPQGLAASNGHVYSAGVLERVGTAPTLYFTRQGYPSFNNRPNKIWNAISGDRMLVLKGAPLAGLDDSVLEPRTAIGINQNGRYLYLVVVDGRQPFYSAGATLQDLAELLVEQGAFLAMNLDGGGSSTMVIEGEDGQPVILNSPVDHYIPGRERAVANHFGVYVTP